MKPAPRIHGDHLIGRVLLGRYRIVRELAKGGMGVVYLARAEGAVGFVKPVVIKLVLPDLSDDSRFVGMFVREAQILSHLRHPSIVDVLELGEEDGAYVMVLEYVRGYHLGQWGAYLRRKGRVVPTEVILQIVIDVLDALHQAHSLSHPDGTPMQIVHRDVSPSNVLLDEDGRGRLLDFGVARMRGGAMQYQTQVKGFVGKFPYTAPEILAGAEASPKTDAYACAVVLHEVLLGRNAFRAETQAATLHRVLHHVPEPASEQRADVSPQLDAVLAKALAKEPEQRYASAAEMASALRKLQPRSEGEVRARLAKLLKQDFSREMADMLGIESLTERDEAWRRISRIPQPYDPDAEPETIAGLDSHVRPVDELEPDVDPDATAGMRPVRAATTRVPSSANLRPPSSANLRPPSSANLRPPSSANLRPPPPNAHLRPPSSANLRPPPVPPPPPLGAFRGSSQKLTLVGLGVVGVLAVVAIVMSLRQPGAPAPAAPSYRIVSQSLETPEPAKATAAPEATTETAAPPDETPAAEAPSPGEAAPTEPAEAPEPAPRPGRRTPKRRTGPDAVSLTKSFRRQQPKIEACFTRHAISLEGKPRMQVAFDLDAAGELQRARLIPESLRATDLGRCVEKVARATRFPAQGEPVSFTIPVTATRVRGGG